MPARAAGGRAGEDYVSKRHTGKAYKGCCAMCAYHTLRGIGWDERVPGRVLKQFGGKTRRIKRNDIPRKEEW